MVRVKETAQNEGRVRPTIVKDRENLDKLAAELLKSGHSTIDHGNGSMDVYKDGKLVKIIKVRNGIA